MDGAGAEAGCGEESGAEVAAATTAEFGSGMPHVRGEGGASRKESGEGVWLAGGGGSTAAAGGALNSDKGIEVQVGVVAEGDAATEQ